MAKNQLKIIKSKYKSNQDAIHEELAAEYGIRLLALLRCNNVNASEMNKVCQIIEEYKDDLNEIGLMWIR